MSEEFLFEIVSQRKEIEEKQLKTVNKINI